MLVEDDSKLAALIQEYLSSYEFKVEIISRGDTALDHYKATLPDIIVLDLMLPGLDGMVVCQHIREISKVPILILTAREDMFDEVSGLEQGADDYINKPIQPRILLARLRALLRRGARKLSTPNAPLSFGELEISKTDRSVRWKNETYNLSNSEFKLLLLLAESAGRVLSRDDILKSMRGIEFDGTDRSIDNSISRLRRKFNDHDSKKIKTIWGEGYLFSPSAWE
ncbi:DNA-binding response regulator [Iodobacter fluviatilis]|uniref:DNA-binding response regulator n=2 Tax=Iodobacter fluviatilis TaxID=537 RepID=A0A7G3GFA9_9NEIS|nr:DNA-binding response regulator [Iodobacter fluviatilis]